MYEDVKLVDSEKVNFEENRKDFHDNFKYQINNFLYKYVPGKLTIDEFEELTLDTYIRVAKEGKKFV
jgi:hypothetical protein